MRETFVALDLREQRPPVGREPERLGGAGLAQGHHDAPGGANGLGDAPPGLFETLSQPLALKGIDGVLGKLPLHVLPAEQRADRVARRGDAVPGGRGQHHHVPVYAGLVRPRGLGEVAACRRARPAGLRCGLRAEHRVAELAVVGEVPRRLRQHMHLRTGGAGAFGEAPGAAGFVLQAPLHRVVGDPLGARLVVHLLEVRAVAETPGPGEPARSPGGGADGGGVVQVAVVQEPGELPPASQRLVEVDRAGCAGADHPHELRGVRLVPDGLGVEEHRHHRLLRLALAERRDLPLDAARDLELLLQQGPPVRPGPLRRLLRGRDAGEVGHRIRDPVHPGRRQQGGRADHRALVPALGVPERRGQGAQDPPRPLEPGELGPAAVETRRPDRGGTDSSCGTAPPPRASSASWRGRGRPGRARRR